MVLHSQFTHPIHTTTNYTPSPQELSEIRTILNTPSSRLSEIDAQIARLLSERTEIQSFVEHHESLLTPFRRLPTDLWREIFVYCLPNYKLDVSLRTTKEAPLLLTRVCRGWRHVAVTTPRLWNKIHIFLPSPKGIPDFRSVMEKRREGVQVWLDRSGDLPLTLSVSTGISGLARDGEQDCFGEFMDLLSGYSRRWKTLAFGHRVGTLSPKSFERLRSEDLPLLETVYTASNLFSFHGDPLAPPSSTSFGSLITRAPSLQSLHLTTELISVVDLPIDWAQLKELRIDTLTTIGSNILEPSQLVQKLAERCTSLHTLTIRTSLPYPPHVFSTPDEPIEWPSLHTFDIKFEGYCYQFGGGGGGQPQTRFSPGIHNTLNAFTAPNLRRLAVHALSFSASGSAEGPNGFPFSEESAPFEGLIVRSNCGSGLEELDVSLPRSLGAEVVAKSLRLLPGLKRLKLGYPVRLSLHGEEPEMKVLREWIRAVFQALLLSDSTPDSDSSQTLCPQLEKLECDGCYPDSSFLSLVLDVSSSSRSQLRHLKADFGIVTKDQVELIRGFYRMAQKQRDAGGKLDVEWTWEEEQKSDEDAWREYDRPELGLIGTGEWW
ncbi:hypothetical protein PM082_003940 [Marasmius tenuissimus]|nr:hypothetical protein PM082_003940 [Marasmius tenuissimus]